MAGPSDPYKAPRMSQPAGTGGTALHRSSKGYRERRPLPPSSPQPIAVPRANGTGPEHVYYPRQPQQSAVPSSAFHGNPGPSGSGGSNRGWGAGGSDGFNPSKRRSADGADDLLDNYNYNHFGGKPSGTNSMRPPSGGASQHQNANSHRNRERDRYAHAAQQRMRKTPTIVIADSPNKAEREAAARRKAQQEADEHDREAQERKFAASERADRFKREAMAQVAAEKLAGASSSSKVTKAVSNGRSQLKSRFDAAFEPKDGGKAKPARDKRNEEQERVQERRKKEKEKGKGKDKRRAGGDSDVENECVHVRSPLIGGSDPLTLSATDSAHAAARKPSRAHGQLGTLRGRFSTTPSPASPGSPAEPILSLEAMWEQEAKAERRRAKGKERARDEDDVARLELDSADESPDELLEEEGAYGSCLSPYPPVLIHTRSPPDALPDASTLCPFCDQPLPDDPSPQLLATKAALLRYPHERRPTLKNPRAVRFPEGQHVVRTGAFCKMHHNERTVVPEGKAKGYPTSIAWDELPKCVLSFLCCTSSGGSRGSAGLTRGARSGASTGN